MIWCNYLIILALLMPIQLTLSFFFTGVLAGNFEDTSWAANMESGSSPSNASALVWIVLSGSAAGEVEPDKGKLDFLGVLLSLVWNNRQCYWKHSCPRQKCWYVHQISERPIFPQMFPQVSFSLNPSNLALAGYKVNQKLNYCHTQYNENSWYLQKYSSWMTLYGICTVSEMI